MYAVVINLDRRIDRFEKFKKRCPIPTVERVPAIDGEKLSQYNIPIIKKYLAAGKINNPSELGCAFSHYLIWDKIKDLPENVNVIIMEDDVEFADDFAKAIIPTDLELLYLGGRGNWGKDFIPKPDELAIGWDKINFNVGPRSLYIRKKSNLRGHPTDRCTECYIINPKTARKLVIDLEDKLATCAIDNIINNYIYNDNNLKVFEIFPHPCFIANREDSNIKKIYTPKFSYNLHVNGEDIPFSKKLKLGFVDFWPNFNTEYNFFTLWLTANCKGLLNIIVDNKNPDVLFYSTHGSQHLQYNCRKIFYTAENIRPNINEFYSLGFDSHLNHNQYLVSF